MQDYKPDKVLATLASYGINHFNHHIAALGAQ
jgi:hypothetical protein